MFGWWRWKRRFRGSHLSLNAFGDRNLRIVVSEAVGAGEHLFHLERMGNDKHWRRFGTVAETEFSELMTLLMESGHFVKPTIPGMKSVRQ